MRCNDLRQHNCPNGLKPYLSPNVLPSIVSELPSHAVSRKTCFLCSGVQRLSTNTDCDSGVGLPLTERSLALGSEVRNVREIPFYSNLLVGINLEAQVRLAILVKWLLLSVCQCVSPPHESGKASDQTSTVSVLPIYWTQIAKNICHKTPRIRYL